MSHDGNKNIKTYVVTASKRKFMGHCAQAETAEATSALAG